MNHLGAVATEWLNFLFFIFGNITLGTTSLS
jgi:hypothetical protein